MPQELAGTVRRSVVESVQQLVAPSAADEEQEVKPPVRLTEIIIRHFSFLNFGSSRILGSD